MGGITTGSFTTIMECTNTGIKAVNHYDKKLAEFTAGFLVALHALTIQTYNKDIFHKGGRSMRILTISGYKPMELNIFKENDPRIRFIKAAIEKRLIGFIEEGLEWVIISGQMGVELWTAEVVLDLKEMYDISIAIFPPFENQDKRWPEHLQEKYQELTMVADFYKPIYQGDYRGAFQFRAKNIWLVDKSDGCLLLMDEEFLGSNKYFHEIAKQAGEDYPIFTITPQDLDDIVEEIRMSDPDYWN